MTTGNTTTFYNPAESTAPEPTLIRMRRHGRILLMPTLALIGSTTAIGVFSAGFPELWMTIVFWVAIALAIVGLWLLPLIVWMGNRVIFTTRRVIIYRGLLVRSRQEVLLGRIHDVTVRQNAVQAVFGAGDLLLNTGAETPIRLHDLPKANLVLSALTELVDSQMPLAKQMRRDDQRWTGEL